jgi:putative ABC transport system substrate-binding protein
MTYRWKLRIEMMKRSGMLAAALAAAALAASVSLADAATITIVKSRPLPAYDAAQQGFASVVGGQARITSFSLTGDPAVARRVVAQIRSNPPNIVVALGTEAAGQVGAALSGIPVVFAMVVDPVQSGLVGNPSRPGGNMTGVTLAVPASEVLAALHQAAPEVRRVGIIYDPAQSQRAVREVTDAARDLGLQAVTRVVRSASDVPRAADDLRGKVDALYAQVDGTVYSSQSAKFILLFALRNGIPVVGFSANLVEAGALLAVYPDYVDVGRQAGYIALRILAGENPGTIGVAAPRKALVAINLSVERTLGLRIPQSLRKTADKVFK